ncbi:MAG: M23 family metallopeptidase [Acidimicrobiia bacterium]
MTSPVPRNRIAAAAVLVALAASIPPAAAQDDPASTSSSVPEVTSTTEPGGTSTTSTTSTTTTDPTSTSTSSTLDPSTTTSTTVVPGPGDDPGAGETLPPEPVPVTDVTVPAAVTPPGAEASAYARHAAEVIRRELSVAQAEAVQLEGSYVLAKQRVLDLQLQLDGLERSITEMSGQARASVRRVEAARRRFEARAADALIRGDLGSMAAFAATSDPNGMAHAEVLLSSVLEADRQAMVDYLDARRQVDDGLVDLADRLVATRKALASARAEMVDARRASVDAQFNLSVFAAGSEIVIHGFVFPVGQPHSFGNSFGAPRMMGTGYEHAHQGTDIMAPMGTPLYAAERGLVTRMGSDVLGGTKLWIKGESGTYYYYAHLSAFEPGVVEGTLVEAGTVVGYVGNTGNARGGAPHLHFEIHPDGGPAVNPYPLLKVVDDLVAQRSGSTTG